MIVPHVDRASGAELQGPQPTVLPQLALSLAGSRLGRCGGSQRRQRHAPDREPEFAYLLPAVPAQRLISEHEELLTDC